MVTVQQVFDMAIHLMDEQDENNGATAHVDTNEYRFRTINILNLAIPMLWPFCTNNDSKEPGRELPNMLDPTPLNNPDFSQYLPVDDAFSYGVLPYFLAAELLLDEDIDRSQMLKNKFDMAFAQIRRSEIAAWEQIENPFWTI